MMLGQRDLRAKASMQCLSGLVNEPYFVLFSSVGFNFKVLTLGRLGLASHLVRASLFFGRSCSGYLCPNPKYCWGVLSSPTRLDIGARHTGGYDGESSMEK
jgi:hypothetical protein